MCGRYLIEEKDIEIRNIINDTIKTLGEGVKTGEIYPTNNAPVLIGEDEIKPALMTWGFPNYQNKGVIINARAETAGEKRTFHDAFFTRRCVIPSSGFYEWAHTEGKMQKDKYLFKLPQSNILYMAGFYSDFKIDGVLSKRFIILTTRPNSTIEDIHNRMPVVLSENNVEDWINDTDEAINILDAIPPDLVRFKI